MSKSYAIVGQILGAIAIIAGFYAIIAFIVK